VINRTARTFDSPFKIDGEWQLTWTDADGNIVNQSEWLTNHLTIDGLYKVADLIWGLNSPYLVIGDDSDAGDVITEVYRQAVSTVTQSTNIVRFRTQIGLTDGNGDHTKACIFYGATSVVGTGTMFNILVSNFSKTVSTILTVEVKFTISNA
jgi:hypothetical protein